jgi:hypothetical protein
VCGKSVGGKMVRVVGRRREGEEEKEEKRRRKLIDLPKWKKLWRHASWGITGK